MAVEIPVIVDIEKAFKDAAKRAEPAMRSLKERVSKLQEAMEKIPLKNSKLWAEAGREIMKATEELAKFQQKLSSATTKPGSIKRLNAELSALEEKWNSMSKAQKFDKDGKLKSSAQEIINKFRRLTAESRMFGRSLQEAAAGGQRSMTQFAESTERATSKLGNLIKNAARLFALRIGTTFVKNVRDVTAELEMQRVALASIIQDVDEANTLFRQIKAAALESPFQIKNLITYTKQLAAYRVETSKLFDTTKRLADISAGLGVDMQRLILAYGQVKAASVLRGQELRQFTEAGIPLVALLADKFSELQGKMVSTAEVFELISKRAVPFSMIEQIFNDMTNAGGVFYNMQLKQSETLKGQWMKLKDAVTIMYDEIGNTSEVNAAMKWFIQSLNDLASNWRTVAALIKGTIAAYVALKTASLFIPKLTTSTKLYEKAVLAEARAQSVAKNAALQRLGISKSLSKALLKEAMHLEKAAMATTLLGRGWHQLAAMMAGGGWIAAAVAAVGLLIWRLTESTRAANRLRKELGKIDEETKQSADVATNDFQRLADAIVNATDGSVKQRKALDELKRKYGDVLPSIELNAQAIRNLNGDYTALTAAIRENIEEKAKEQKINTVIDSYNKRINKVQRDLRNVYLVKNNQEAVEELVAALQYDIEHGLAQFDGENLTREYIESILGKNVGPEYTKYYSLFSGYLDNLAKLYKNRQDEINEIVGETTTLVGKYKNIWKELQEELKKTPETTAAVGSFAFNEAKINQAVDIYKKAIQDAFSHAGVDINFGDVLDFGAVSEAARQAGVPHLEAFVKKIRNEYEQMVPSDKLVSVVKGKLKEISDSTGVSMNVMQKYLKNGEDDMEKYAKTVSGDLEQLEKSITEMEFANRNAAPDTIKYTDAEIQATKDEADALRLLVKWLDEFNKKAARSKMADLRDELKDVQAIYKKYQEFLKYMSVNEAQTAIKNIYSGVTSIDFLSPSEYKARLSRILSKMKSLKGPEVSLAEEDQQTLLDTERIVQDVDWEELKNGIDRELERVSRDIKRSETARNFFNDMLNLTGDEQLSTNLTVSVYGDIGQEFRDRLQSSLDGVLSKIDTTKISEEMLGAFESGDTKYIVEHLSEIPEAYHSLIISLADSNEQYLADYLRNFEKTYRKAKEFDERIRVLELQRQQELEKARSAGKSNIDLAAIDEYFNEAVADVKLEELKSSYEWTKTFEDLDRVGTMTLEKLIVMLEKFKKSYSEDLSPESLKAVTQALEKAKDKLDSYNPIKGVAASVKQIYEARQAAIRLRKLDAEQGLSEEEQEKLQQTLDEEAEAYTRLTNSINASAQSLRDIDNLISQVEGLFDVDELSDEAAVIKSIHEGLNMAATALSAVAAGILIVKASAPEFLAIAAAIGAVVAAATAISNIKVARANRELERQQRILDDLEYAYERLQKAEEKVFGAEYIENYNQRLANLQAQIEAYNKQAAAEREKGKKEDEERTREYEKSARQAADEILDMQREVAARMLGSEQADAARDFASAWIDAYKEFGSTTDAIKEKFKDMVQSMIVESMAAKVVENLLSPIYDQIGQLTKDGELGADDAAIIAQMMSESVGTMDSSLTNLMNILSAAGLNFRSFGGSLTGISKDIAGASEESILGLAAGINTQNFYISGIYNSVNNILSYMTGEVTTTNIQQKQLDPDLLMASMSSMQRDLADLRTMFRSVISPKSANASTHYISVR